MAASCRNWSREKKNCGNWVAEIGEKRRERPKKKFCSNEVTENWRIAIKLEERERDRQWGLCNVKKIFYQNLCKTVT